MDDQYDHNQTLVPESFLALHSRHGRPLLPRAEIEARHEFCEDVALHAAAFIAARHQEGDDTGQALQHCLDGLHADATAFAPAEATWVVRRVAELQEWPQPGWLRDADTP
ncbi:MAG: ATPase with chaperone activity [Caldimonas sp.]